jgi:hypothetical protein
MESQKALRVRALVELYRQSGGDIEKKIAVGDLAKGLKADEDAVRIVVNHLQQQFLAFGESDFVQITVLGIEDAELMEQPLVTRFPRDHPYWFGLFIAIGTIVLNKVVDLIFKSLTHI